MKIHKSILGFNLIILLLMIINLGLIYSAFDGDSVANEKGHSFGIYVTGILVILLMLVSMIFQTRLIKKFKLKLSEQINRFMGITDSLNEGTNNLSRRTGDQAASLEETASTMEEITSTVKQNSEHSTLAVGLTNEALKVAKEGTHLSKEVQGAMDEITSSSNKISDIVGLVEEIAFQTNILAINAAIEAAKAGDIGKGFAVVAIEVRDLAQRSADAAKEIKTLIDNSIAKVEKGSELVAHSNQNLLNIAEGIQKVADIMGDVSSATNEQFTAIDQISDTVTQLDVATQDNTSLVDSLTNSSDKLKDIVSELNTLVVAFLPESEGLDQNKIKIDKKNIKNVSAPQVKVEATESKKPENSVNVKEEVKAPVVKPEIKKPQVKSVKKKIITKSSSIKKPVIKKDVSKTVTTPVEGPKLTQEKPENEIEFFDDAMLGRTMDEKNKTTPQPKTPVRSSIPGKKSKVSGDDDVVESILSRDPNFFDSGEDF